VSVINKMLRDLDSRETSAAMPGAVMQARSGIARDTSIVSDSGRAGRGLDSSRRVVLLAAVGLLLAGAAGAWWYLNHPLNPVIPAMPQNPTRAPVSPIALNSVTPQVDSQPKPAVSVLAPAAVPAPVPVPTSAPAPVPRSNSPQADFSLKMDSSFHWAPASAAPAKPVATVTPRVAPERAVGASAASAANATPPVRQNVPRESPALEALAQAQSLWNAGSHEAAIDLVAQALALAERANAAGAPSGSLLVLTALARELARMELAQGRVGQSLAMLTRLEPTLTDVADVWALRGNAAQRLGRHAESAAAYLTALKLKPNEPRWMLGAAVSLAAQGQTAAAAELADKARAAGVVSPEVGAYLRQLGVPLRER
jgi:MSHA biogenesis protein MshN